VIEYGIASEGDVRLIVVDERGRRVATLVDKPQVAGEYTLPFAGDGLPSGVYYYILESNGERIVRSMSLSK
jgi:hypothetical protein